MTAAWVSMLSRRQRRWVLGTGVVMFAIVSGGLYLTAPCAEQQQAFSVEMSIRQVAPKLGITAKALARDLGLRLDAPKQKPLAALGVTDEALQHAVHHIQSHNATGLKYFVFAALVLGALVFLVKIGRPDAGRPDERQYWYPRGVRLAFLMAAVVVCGFVLGKSPNPMEATVKVLKSAIGLYPDPWTRVLFLLLCIVLAVVGNKVICGWACPFGALQDLIHSLPMPGRGMRKLKLPFVLTNTIRTALFLCTLILMFGIIGDREGFVIYHYLNPFNLFALDIETLSVGITIAASLTLATVVYRPFCQLICPFGLVSWLAERVSFFRVRVNHAACVDCGACTEACPSNAMADRLNQRTFPADCFSCGRCLNACPTGAITYTGRARRTDA